MTTYTITRNVERADFGFVAEASEIGLAPGEWPDEVVLADRIFARVHIAFNEPGEVGHVDYASGKDTLRIFND